MCFQVWLFRDSNHIWEDYVVPFCVVFSFLFWSGIFCWPSLGFNKSPGRVAAGFQSLLHMFLFPGFSLSVWYFLYSVVLSSNYAQFLLKWMVIIKEEVLVCVCGFSVHLNFKAPPSSLRETAQSRNVKFAVMHLTLLKWCDLPMSYCGKRATTIHSSGVFLSTPSID